MLVKRLSFKSAHCKICQGDSTLHETTPRLNSVLTFEKFGDLPRNLKNF